MNMSINDWKIICKILSNVEHWETCPNEYKKDIENLRKKFVFIQ